MAVVDTYFAAAAVPEKIPLVQGRRKGCTRLGVLMSSTAKQPSYGLRFTSSLIQVLRAGIALERETLELPAIKRAIDSRGTTQPSILFAYDGVRATEGSGLGLWLARNRQELDSWEGTLDVEWVYELTQAYSSAPSELELRKALGNSRRVRLTGPPGSGKSTLAAALTRDDLVGKSSAVQAMVFCDSRHNLADLSTVVSNQLSIRLPSLFRDQFLRAREKSRATNQMNTAADS